MARTACSQTQYDSARAVRGVGRPFDNASRCLQEQVAAQRGFATAKDLTDSRVCPPAMRTRWSLRRSGSACSAAWTWRLPLNTLTSFHAAIESDVHTVLSLRGSLDARQVQGGTAPVRVRGQIAAHRARLG